MSSYGLTAKGSGLTRANSVSIRTLWSPSLPLTISGDRVHSNFGDCHVGPGGCSTESQH